MSAGETMFEKRKYFLENLDHIRQSLILEPRGYPCTNLDFMVPSTKASSKWGYIIAEQNAIYPLMSGHNTICVCTALLETGRIEMEFPVTKFEVEAPGGLIQIEAMCCEKTRKAKEIKFRNMESFSALVGVEVKGIPDLGSVKVDLAFGGMWFYFASAARKSQFAGRSSSPDVK